jgi:predicted benzoate:H+ symporter BenE
LDSGLITRDLGAVVGMVVCTIGLSLHTRAPIVVAWSTPVQRY